MKPAKPFSVRFLPALTLALLASATQPAVASADDAARSAGARALFAQGLEFSDRGQWPEAADRFRRALALRQSPVIRYNLAVALDEAGKVVESAELLRQVIHDESAPPDLRATAKARLPRVAPRAATITIKLGAAEGEVYLDDKPLPGAQIGVPFPIDPGRHTFALRANSKVIASVSRELAEGKRDEVLLAPQETAPSPAEAAATVAPTPTQAAVGPAPPARDDRERNTRKHQNRKKKWWIIGAAGGAAVVAAAVVTAVLVAGGGQSPRAYQGDFDTPSLDVEVVK